MNLLLINHYAGTPELGMEYRPYYLAREWVRQGHQVHIVADRAQLLDADGQGRELARLIKAQFNASAR